MSKGQTFEQLYQEQTPLYEEFADLIIAGKEMHAEQVAAMIEDQIQHFDSSLVSWSITTNQWTLFPKILPQIISK